MDGGGGGGLDGGLGGDGALDLSSAPLIELFVDDIAVVRRIEFVS